MGWVLTWAWSLGGLGRENRGPGLLESARTIEWIEGKAGLVFSIKHCRWTGEEQQLSSFSQSRVCLKALLQGYVDSSERMGGQDPRQPAAIMTSRNSNRAAATAAAATNKPRNAETRAAQGDEELTQEQEKEEIRRQEASLDYHHLQVPQKRTYLSSTSLTNPWLCLKSQSLSKVSSPGEILPQHQTSSLHLHLLLASWPLLEPMDPGFPPISPIILSEPHGEVGWEKQKLILNFIAGCPKTLWAGSGEAK
ncbi:hypothetical protein BDBG_03237 [Blastomyces gilchristii SLH14081]|uniref:Uncharacterized protein n=1 Tax=Blastomyces gilchristii (strain SLH14081) TaxID=559298 RepID=A0A179UH09_BLAGS|nr:uncharacterized protein BDBG_03237 [Blastomyces gilchristii SLH14081]OAT07140.1 hypothetical protein BDBG_03237 [Blastomyces gilchristii SLH14081]